jgi:hypothetical protein
MKVNPMPEHKIVFLDDDHVIRLGRASISVNLMALHMDRAAHELLAL